MKNIFIIFIILYLDLIAFTLILPLFPSIIEHYDTKNELATTSDSALDAIHHTMEFMRKLLNMPDRSRYNQVLIGGRLSVIDENTFSLTRTFLSLSAALRQN